MTRYQSKKLHGEAKEDKASDSGMKTRSQLSGKDFEYKISKKAD
jgi:hypothetical protein